MAASDDLPRGGYFAVRSAVGNQALITLPACPGICHVLTGIAASLTAAAAANASDVIEVTDPSGYLIGNALLEIDLAATAASQQATASWSGKIVGNPNTAMTIRHFAGIANVVEQLQISWYDI